MAFGPTPPHSGDMQPPSLLSSALEPLKVVGDSIYAHAVGYVSSADPIDAPLELAAVSDEDLAGLLGDPGDCNWPHAWRLDSLTPRVRKRLGGKKLRSCHNDHFRLYVTRDLLSPEQWVRFARLLSACGDITPATDPEVVPGWLSILWGTSQRVDPTGNEHKATRWDSSFPLALLEADGFAPGDAVRAVSQLVLRVAPYRWGPLRYPYLTDFVAFATEHPEAILAEYRSSAVRDKMHLLESIRQDPALRQSLDAVLGLALQDTAKTVREAGVALISGLGSEERANRLAAAIEEAPAGRIDTAIDMLARLADAEAVAALSRLAQHCTGKKAQLLTAALDRVELASSANAPELIVAPMIPAIDTPLPPRFVDDAVVRCAAGLSKAQEQLTQTAPEQDWRVTYLRKQISMLEKLEPKDFESVRLYLNGEGARPPFLADLVQADVLPTRGVSLVQAIRLLGLTWNLGSIVDHDVDLRTLLDAAERAGVPETRQTSEDYVAQLPFNWQGLSHHSVENIWPFYTEHPRVLDRALGMDQDIALTTHNYNENSDLTTAIEILAAFPTMPDKYVARLTELALGSAKRHRLHAQEALTVRPNVVGIATQGLNDSRAEVRATAAAWLGRLGARDSVPALRSALAKEKRETAKAALLGALHALGQDLSVDLSSDALLAEASAGLKKAQPAALSWYHHDLTPALTWADGSTVDPKIISWWLILATRLKDPLGAGLIPIYISLLSQDSQAELGEHVLRAWIAEDSATVSDAAATERATQDVDAVYNQNQLYLKRHPTSQWAQEVGSKTKAEVYEELRRAALSEYVGTASPSKGVLSLTVGAPGHVVQAATMNYIRDHGARRAQIEALVTAASGNDDPAAIQLVLQIARRFKQRTVQEKAASLIEAIADRRGWSADELADQTMPTAGFDDDGLLHLSYGPREFLGRLGRSTNGQWHIALSSEQGTPVKALPSAAKSDDADAVKAAKKQLTTSKKELKQLATIQTGRLFEAMCLQRTWPAQQWSSLIAGHPVLSQLITGLVWHIAVPEPDLAEADDAFRLTAEGDLIGIDDEVFTLPDGVAVSLAHSVTLTPVAVERWREHLADFDLDPLFDQFATQLVDVAEGVNQIDSHLGWLSDAFAIRGRATKRGYSRSQAEDGGWFTEYRRDYTSIGLAAVIEFTGNALPEELIPAAVTTLSFEPLRGGKPRELTTIPPILLAESVSDYHYVAEAGTFDPEWEKKSRY